MKRQYQFVLGLFLLMATAFPPHSLAGKWCVLCGMDLEKYRLTRYVLTLDNGKTIETCSIHCAGIVLKKEDVKRVEVADYLSGSMLDADKACYVIGSDIRGVMSKRSKLAFISMDKAKRFQQKHGGESAGFEVALSEAGKDLADDVKMLKKKIEKMILLGRVMAEKNSCFVCHGKDGKGGIKNPGADTGIIPAWSTNEFVLKIGSKAELKDIILDGGLKKSKNNSRCTDGKDRARIKMPAWKGFIQGKTLHALVNYIWSLRQAR